jgi:hypothetical protein
MKFLLGRSWTFSVALAPPASLQHCNQSDFMITNLSISYDVRLISNVVPLRSVERAHLCGADAYSQSIRLYQAYYRPTVIKFTALRHRDVSLNFTYFYRDQAI